MGIQVCTEVGCVVFPEDDFQALQLFAVAIWDGDFDVDALAGLVGDGAVEGAGEEGADAGGGKELEC